MTAIDDKLLALVRCSVCDSCSDTLDFSGVDWTALIKQSYHQTIPILIIDGLQKYLMSHPTETPFANASEKDQIKRMQWFAQMMVHERLYVQHEKAMAELAALYATKGIRMMVLKGYGLSLDWPVPNHRPVGDLDTYNFGRWKEADVLVEEKCGIKIDEGHEHHTVFRFKSVFVENHYDFINVRAHRDAPKIEEKLKALAQDCKEKEVQGEKICLPSANFNAVFLMRHMGQHFAGEHLNLRQILDWGFFVRANHQDVDWKTTIDFLWEIGLYAFFNQINAICIDYLGFAEDVFPVVERNKALEERIIADILQPEFAEEKPTSGLLPILAFKFRRWWHNRWKHPLVYKERLLPMFLTLLWSHLRRIRTIKD